MAGTGVLPSDIADNMLSGLIVVELLPDAEGRTAGHRIVGANAALEEQTGLKRQDVLGMTTDDLCRFWPWDGFFQRCDDIALRGGSLHMESYSAALGRHFDMRVFSPGKARFAVALYDITERKRAEAELRRMNRELRALSECNQALVRAEDEGSLLVSICRIICEAGGYRMAWVGYAERDEAKTVRPVAWGGEEGGFLSGMDVRWSRAERGCCPVGISIRTGKASFVQDLAADPRSAGWRDEALRRGYRSYIALPLKDGEGKPFGCLCIYSPETEAFTEAEVRLLGELAEDLAYGIRSLRMEAERKKAAEAMANVERIEMLGALAGGIAHDFNNLLAGIFGYIDMAAASTADQRTASFLEMAQKAMDRAKGLTRQLLAFSRGGAPLKKTGPVFPLVREAALFALSGSNVSVSFDAPDDLPPCDFDAGQLTQVVDNLVINARQAMPAGGALRVWARKAALGPGEHPALPAGPYLKISFSDSGSGIKEEILPRIFEPFFTTKRDGHGLGLASCYSIVHRHGGSIDVESREGLGTTFTVWLPASGRAVEPDKRPAPSSFHRGSGTFMVMDDEESIRTITKDMLSAFGYEVVCARDGAEAVERFSASRRGGQRMAGLLLDLTIPGGMGGKEAIAAIRAEDRSVPAFVFSGYAEDPIIADPTAYGFTASIGKPFKIAELSAMLNAHMAGARAG